MFITFVITILLLGFFPQQNHNNLFTFSTSNSSLTDKIFSIFILEHGYYFVLYIKPFFFPPKELSCSLCSKEGNDTHIQSINLNFPWDSLDDNWIRGLHQGRSAGHIISNQKHEARVKFSEFCLYLIIFRSALQFKSS